MIEAYLKQINGYTIRKKHVRMREKIEKKRENIEEKTRMNNNKNTCFDIFFRLSQFSHVFSIVARFFNFVNLS